MHKLDLVKIFINGNRKLLSKWLEISYDDIVLLSNNDLDVNEYDIKCRFLGTEQFTPIEKESFCFFQPANGMEIHVTKIIGSNK